VTSIVFSILLLLQTAGPAPKPVTGRISIDGGAPIPSSFTLPLMLDGGANQLLTIRLQIDGSFRVQLRPGEYRVGAPTRLPPGYSLQSIAYGGVDLLRNPLKISADNSSELLINLATSGPPPTFSVSGRVTGITPGQITRISLRESSGGELSAALETSIGTDGTFTFPRVLPGTYIVYMRLLSQTPVIVTNKDVTDLIVAFPKEILVSAHVIAEDPPAAPPAVGLEAKGPVGTTQSRGSGSFVLSVGKGENSISVIDIPPAYRLKSITYGDVDLQKAPLKLDGPAVWDIIVRLAPRN